MKDFWRFMLLSVLLCAGTSLMAWSEQREHVGGRIIAMCFLNAFIVYVQKKPSK